MFCVWPGVSSLASFIFHITINAAEVVCVEFWKVYPQFCLKETAATMSPCSLSFCLYSEDVLPGTETWVLVRSKVITEFVTQPYFRSFLLQLHRALWVAGTPTAAAPYYTFGLHLTPPHGHQAIAFKIPFQAWVPNEALVSDIWGRSLTPKGGSPQRALNLLQSLQGWRNSWFP